MSLNIKSRKRLFTRLRVFCVMLLCICASFVFIEAIRAEKNENT